MIASSISFFMLILIYFCLGMYKPRMVLFGMKKPNRLSVIIFTSIAVMMAATMFGAGVKHKQDPLSEQTAETTKSEAKTTIEIPKPADSNEPVPELPPPGSSSEKSAGVKTDVKAEAEPTKQ